MPENSTNIECGYHLPTVSTPKAQELTEQSHFCDKRLQDQIINPTEKIDISCSDPKNCPHKIPETNLSKKIKNLLK